MYWFTLQQISRVKLPMIFLKTLKEAVTKGLELALANHRRMLESIELCSTNDVLL